MLGDLAAAGAVAIRLSLRQEGDAVGLLIQGSDVFSARRLRFYRRKFGLAGASLAISRDGTGLFLVLQAVNRMRQA
ncbi:MAG: hypothetical protein BWX50_01184 [Euryarchaeota archaeon ADurb.Bin009]|nr:MAG: hypothetical protein BWX50_01184 [Euryarchaeota archaeon ADurb.Bin009]